MLAIFNAAREIGADAISFRKLKYRLAILNERQYGDPGLGVIRGLISENPSYDKYHAAFRWMLRKHPDLIEAYRASRDEGMEKAEEGELVKLLLDQECSEEAFLEHLRTARAEKNEEWNEYRRLINSLKLPMAF